MAIEYRHFLQALDVGKGTGMGDDKGAVLGVKCVHCVVSCTWWSCRLVSYLCHHFSTHFKM